MKSVSVIIPLFNKEPYVADCLSSLRTQTHKPLEVIVVDDGSTDASLDIVRKEHARFETAGIELRIIEREHRGVSHVLNDGFSSAQGTYVTRVDADDIVSPLWLDTLLSQDKAHRPVSIRCSHMRISHTPQFSDIEQPNLKHAVAQEIAFNLPALTSGNELYHQLFAEMNTNLMSTCGTLYVRKDLERDAITFNETLTHTEDLLFNAQYFAHNNPAIVVADPLYYYRQVDDSLSHAASNLFDAVTTLDAELTKLTQSTATRQIARENEHAVLRYLCWYYSIAILDLEKSSTKDEFESALKIGLASSSMKEVFERATQAHSVPQLAQRLYSLAQNKQYAQLRLAARTINLGRSIRRSLKTS